MKIKNLLNIISFVLAALSYLTVVYDIGVYYNILFISLYLIAILNVVYFRVDPPKKLLNISVVILIVLIFNNVNLETLNLKVIRALSFLLFIKLLNLKYYRDYIQTLALCFFLVAGGSLVNLNLSFIVLMATVIFLSIFQLILLSFFSFNKEYIFSKSIILAILQRNIVSFLLIVPISIFIFLIIPRPSFPLFDILNNTNNKAYSGFVDTISLGNNSDIYEDERVAFRARMPEMDKKHLFWRGVELNSFDGKNWTYSTTKRKNKAFLKKDIIIKQDIYLAPLNSKYLIALDKPININGSNDIKFNNYTLSFNKKLNKSIHYTVYSNLSPLIYERNIDKALYTDLPTIDKDIVRLAKKLKDKTTVKTIKNTLEFFNSGNFTYTIKNLPKSKKPLKDFLFKNRNGNCELFASAFAVLLRLNNIPVRLISGFYGGVYNKYLEYYIVPFSGSHIWAEVWIDGKWIRVNPSPEKADGVNRSNQMNGIGIFLDSIRYYWVQYVINYDLDKQLYLYNKIKNPVISIKFTDKTKFLKLCIIILVIIFIILILYKIIRVKKCSYAEVLINDLERILKKKYSIIRNNKCLLELIDSLDIDRVKKEKLSNWANEVMGYFYRDRQIRKDVFHKLRSELITTLK